MNPYGDQLDPSELYGSGQGFVKFDVELCPRCNQYFRRLDLHQCNGVKVNEAPLCECGCGEPVQSQFNGTWSRWRPGHQKKHRPRIGEAWCAQHQMHPNECFEIHYPHAFGGYTKCNHCGYWIKDDEFESHVRNTISVDGGTYDG